MTYSECLTLKKLLSRCSAWAYAFRQRLHLAGEPLEHIERHIDEITGSFSMLANPPSETQCNNVSDRENEKDSRDDLTSAIHGLTVELVRATERFRSLSEVASKCDLNNTEKNITMKLSELQGSLQEVKTSALKALSEIRSRVDALDAKITELTSELANATVPADAQATLADIRGIHKQLDDIVPDAPELPPPTIPPTEPAARR